MRLRSLLNINNVNVTPTNLIPPETLSEPWSLGLRFLELWRTRRHRQLRA